ncbi:MAG: hypothetical protein K9I68_02445 [Bacteroidales bacterium]|nr:hypothetical protein [Bacteroidales bacterium]MCF8337173.1 hypothetical protein [Bacteroidales bacterium]
MTDIERIMADVEREKVTPKILKIVEHRSLPLVIRPHRDNETPLLQKDFDLTDAEYQSVMEYLDQNFVTHVVRPPER